MALTDCHTHTEISPDSEAKITDMLTAAQNAGLAAYAVTDHIELCRWYPQGYYKTQPRNEEDFYDYAVRFELSMAQNLMMREQCPEDMAFVCGIEMGEPDVDWKLSSRIYLDERLDFVIASLHELQGKLDFYFLDYTKEDVEPLLDRYFTDLLAIAQHDCYDVLGHITYPLRYIEGEAGIRVKHERCREAAAEIFRAAIALGKGIELNTSGYRQKYGKPFPDETLLRLYKDLGGTILTLGSDAHKPEDVAGGIAQGADLARACGFEKVCYYQKHEPHFITL